MIDPVKGLAELITKWRKLAEECAEDRQCGACNLDRADELAAAIPAVQAAFAEAEAKTAAFCGEVISLRAELAALREPMACGHPRACLSGKNHPHAFGDSCGPECPLCTACAGEQDRIRLAEAAALERIAGVCDFAANGTIEAMSEPERSETWKIIAQNSVEQYRSIAAKTRILISHPLLEEHNAEVRDLALEEAAICAKRCETWYEGHGDATASHAADEIRALKGPKQ